MQKNISPFPRGLIGRLIITCFCLAAWGQAVKAQTNGTPTGYQVTVHEVSLCTNAACTTKAVLGGSSTQFNLGDAAAAAGAIAGTFAGAGGAIPFGTYTHLLLVLGQDVILTGRILDITGGAPTFHCDTVAGRNDRTDFTEDGNAIAAATANTPGGTTVSIPAINQNIGPATISTAGGRITIIIQIAPITLAENGATPPPIPQIRVDFDVTNAMSGSPVNGFAGAGDRQCQINLGAPTITMSIGAVRVVLNFPIPAGPPPVVGGGVAPPPVVFSDIRLKRDVVQIATLENGIKIYSFKYLWDQEVHVGVMAQDLLAHAARKRAVAMMPSGFYAVDYAMLGLKMTTLQAWRESGIKSVLLSSPARRAVSLSQTPLH